MTCKDCVHYEVCQTRDGQTEFYGLDVDYRNVEELCDHFKLKSRFVELPCEVGQTVYNLIGGFAEEMKVNRFVLILKRNDQYPIDFIKELGDFGKTVFLSREEAENALKERAKE